MRLEDELAIQRTLATYCQCMDDGDFRRITTEVFTADGSFVDRGETSTGSEAIEARLHAIHPPSRRGKHVSVNPIIDVRGESADVSSDFVFLGWKEGRYLVVRSAGRYIDSFRRVDGAWRIQRRDIQMLARSGEDVAP